MKAFFFSSIKGAMGKSDVCNCMPSDCMSFFFLFPTFAFFLAQPPVGVEGALGTE